MSPRINIKLLDRLVAALIISIGIVVMLVGEPEKVEAPQDIPSSQPTSGTDFTGTPALATPTAEPVPFSFASMGDAHIEVTNFNATADQIEDMNPDFVIFNGDLENDGVVSSEMDPMIAVLKKDGLFDKTFLVRGNHDNHIDGSKALWESYFQNLSATRPLPEGVTNYVSLDPSSYYLTYSFNYSNSIFIGLDDPGNVDLLRSDELSFLDARLKYAENESLDHAFIFFHGPFYCVESMHCDCTARTDSSCTPESLIAIINKHPIVSATFQGHEHILGWTHMDNTRVAGLSGSFEQFITSPAGGWSYNDYLYPDRIDYYVPDMGTGQGFGFITVNGDQFTYSLYKTGEAQPEWSKTFSK
jgi:hypothetical protein